MGNLENSSIRQSLSETIRRIKKRFQKRSITQKIIMLTLCSGIVMFLLSIMIIRLVEASYVKYVYDTKTENLNSSIGLIEASLGKIEERTYQFITNNRVQDSVSEWLRAEDGLQEMNQTQQGQEAEDSSKVFQRSKTVSVLDILKVLDNSLAGNSDIMGGFYLAPDGKRYNGYSSSDIVISEEKKSKILEAAQVRMGDPVYIVSTENSHAVSLNQEEKNRKKTQIIIARAIKEKENLSMRYGGTLVYLVDLEALTASYTSDFHKLVICDNTGAVIFSTLTEEEQADFSGDRVSEDGYEIMTLGNTKYFLTEIISGEHDWSYYSISSYQQLFGLLSNADRIFIVLFVLLFVPILAVTVRISVSLVKPISELSGTIKGIRGNHELADNLRGAGQEENLPGIRSDEIGELQRQFYSMVQELDELIHENYEQRIYLQEAQLSALRTQLNPHFLYNTLDTIRWMATAKDYQQIPGVVKALGDILRLCMNSRKNLISVGEEIDYLRGYIAIQKIRFGERLRFMIEVEEELMELAIPAFSIQPLVENSINYGLEQMLEPCCIVVSIVDCGDDLLVSVKDNGPGMDTDILEKMREGTVKARGNGIGLENLDKRLKNLYGASYGIFIECPETGGTVISYHVRKEMYAGLCEG